MGRLHEYNVNVIWNGNSEVTKTSEQAHGRSHRIWSGAKQPIMGSADPAFFWGDPSKWNPEELLIAAISACHKLWYLKLCTDNGIVVSSYADCATGQMRVDENGGQFLNVRLAPVVSIKPLSDLVLAKSLHQVASQKSFIRNSLNFMVEYDAKVTFEC